MDVLARLSRPHRGRTRRVAVHAAVLLTALAVLTPVGGGAPAGATPAPGEREERSEAESRSASGRRLSEPATALAVEPGTFTGLGFDACTAPSDAAMRAWLASPYRAVGVYFGGGARACAQPNLTAAWVSARQAEGWRLMPLYVGPQAPCTTSNKPLRIDPTKAAQQGREIADDAIVQANAIGLTENSVLIYDMEAYRTGDAACRTAVLTFLSAWTARLHDRRYFSGVYSSMGSGIADLVTEYHSGTLVHPDHVDFARWDQQAVVTDPAIPATYWWPKRRIKQYRGDHLETHGGVTINIDNDYLDVAPLPATPFGDVGGNGWSDLLARQKSTGRLLRYDGNGSFLTAPTVVSDGWSGMTAIARLGDLNRDGTDDFVSRESATGTLWLYPGDGSGGFGARSSLGTGWNGFREITPVGDLDRDGFGDILAVRTSTGVLYAYRGRAGGLHPGVSFGSGWNALDQLTGVGDFNRDGFVDLVARLKSTGDLYLYPGRGFGFAPRIRISSGWQGMRGITSIGDIDRDGFVDLVAIESATGVMYRFTGRGTGLVNRVLIGRGWTGLDIVL